MRNPGQILATIKGRRIHKALLAVRSRVLLQVIVKEDATAYHVVTAYKTTRIAKYWRSS